MIPTPKCVIGELRILPMTDIPYIIVYHDTLDTRGRWLNILKFDTRGVWRDSYSDEYLNWRNGKISDPEEWL